MGVETQTLFFISCCGRVYRRATYVNWKCSASLCSFLTQPNEIKGTCWDGKGYPDLNLLKPKCSEYTFPNNSTLWLQRSIVQGFVEIIFLKPFVQSDWCTSSGPAYSTVWYRHCKAGVYRLAFPNCSSYSFLLLILTPRQKRINALEKKRLHSGAQDEREREREREREGERGWVRQKQPHSSHAEVGLENQTFSC